MYAIEECEEIGWTLYRTVTGNLIKMSLFKREGKKYVNKVHYHACCCGILKSGFWDIAGKDPVAEIREKTMELIAEYQQDTLQERELFIQATRECHEDDYGFRQ
jgi:hypothetical protein